MKRNGPIKYFSYLTEYSVLYIVGYDLEKVNEDMYSWHELILFKDEYNKLDIDTIKEVIINDINNRTDETILNGFVWKEMPIYLSKENLFNFKAAYDLALQTQGASLPVKFKLGQTPSYNENIGTEDEPNIVKRGGDPIYYTFETLGDISNFYISAIAFINLTLNEGWLKKDNIDWSKYELSGLLTNQESEE